jgi:hypothetical protein
VVEVSGNHLLIHAAAVEAATGAVVLPAPPDAGKTTLTAALVMVGLLYLTDEVVAISAATGDILPFPRPLTLERESLAALADLDPAAPLRWAPADPKRTSFLAQESQRWWHLTASSIRPAALGRPCPPRTVIFPRYRPGRETRLEPIGTSEAVLELATNTFNLDQHGGQGLAQLARLAEQSSCFRLDISDLDDASRLVLSVAPRT